MTRSRFRLFIAFILSGAVCQTASANSLCDTLNLGEVTVKTVAPQRGVRAETDGTLTISTSAGAAQPSLLGGNDPISVLRTLPAIQTPNDLQAGISVRGMGYGDNLWSMEGVRVFNPMHMLGLFSAFNPAYVTSVRFNPTYTPAHRRGAPGGVFDACANNDPEADCGLNASVGLIESHVGGTWKVVPGRLSLRGGVRQTYINEVFPRLLKVGNSWLRYDFTDANASVAARVADSHLITATGFYSRDNMKLVNSDKGAKDGDFGWRNLGTGVTWLHNDMSAGTSYSRFTNRFFFNEGGRDLDLPSMAEEMRVNGQLAHGDFVFTIDVTGRHVSGQQNQAGVAEPEDRSSRSLEENLGMSWKHPLSRLFELECGLRLAGYQAKRYFKILPQPRAQLNYKWLEGQTMTLSAGRYVEFDRLIQETTGGLPADFITLAGKGKSPADVWSGTFGLTGTVPGVAFVYGLEGYCRRVLNVSEFGGSLIDLSNSGYNAEEHLVWGNGYSAGVSLMVMRQVGAVKGRIAYTFGRSRLRFDRYGSGMFPANYDRTHDLTVNVSWTPVRNVTLAAVYTHATGLPYTRARYGYMIEENLICEYFPHNSSRLPSYNRADASVTWNFLRRGGISHSLNVSVYNVLAFRNVLFQFPSYSPADGIKHNRSVMRSVIPAITYTISL